MKSELIQTLILVSVLILFFAGISLTGNCLSKTAREEGSSATTSATPSATPKPSVPFLVSGDPGNCRNLDQRGSRSLKFWIYNPEASRAKIFVDDNALNVSEEVEDTDTGENCIIGGSLGSLGKGGIRTELSSYTGPGIIEIRAPNGRIIKHETNEDDGPLLINLSARHRVTVTSHTYSKYDFGFDGPSSESVRGLGFLRIREKYPYVYEFGEKVPSTITVSRDPRSVVMSETRLALSASPMRRKSSSY